MTTGRRRDRPFRRYLPAVALTIALAADIAAVVISVATNRAGGNSPFDVFFVGGLVAGATYGIVGWIIASRRPDNAIGWVFLAIGLSQSIDVFAGVYSVYGLAVAPGSLPFAAELSWVVLWAWAPGFILLVTLSVLLFPDGRPPSPRWRPVVWASLAVIALLVVPFAIVAWPYRGEALLFTDARPTGGALGVAFGLQFIGLLASPFVALASIAGMVVRFRRSGPTERQQLKWFTFAAVPEIAFIVSVGFVTYPPLLGALGAILFGPLLPIAAAIAILRYRLYEIDLLINRTFVYGALTAILAGVYTASITLTTRVFSAITGERSDAAIVLTTLIVVSLFTPLKSRLQSAVDKRMKAPHSGVAAATGEVVPAVTPEQLRALHAEWHRSADEGR